MTFMQASAPTLRTWRLSEVVNNPKSRFRWQFVFHTIEFSFELRLHIRNMVHDAEDTRDALQKT